MKVFFRRLYIHCQSLVILLFFRRFQPTRNKHNKTQYRTRRVMTIHRKTILMIPHNDMPFAWIDKSYILVDWIMYYSFKTFLQQPIQPPICSVSPLVT